MPKKHVRSIAEQLKRVPASTRLTVKAARQLVKAVAPHAVELAYHSQPPRSPSALWKLARYALEGTNVVGIGTFRTHSLLFFYGGKELDDRTALLEGGGKNDAIHSTSLAGGRSASRGEADGAQGVRTRCTGE